VSEELVVGIDSSTTAIKAIAWNSDGQPVAEGRCALFLSEPQPGRYEQDPEAWWWATVAALAALTNQVGSKRIAALAVANQRETFAALRADGSAVRPAILWLDERCKPEVEPLAQHIGADVLMQVTGKPRDWAPVIYRLAWMRHHEPELYADTTWFTDVHAYLVLRLTGTCRTSWASADPFGLFDIHTRSWSTPILDALGLGPERLPEALAPGSVLGSVTAAAAAVTGLRTGTRVIAGGGDGQAAGLGVGALRPERAYLNLGTAVVSGVYSRECRTDLAWRTLCSCSGTGYYLESSLRSGTFLIDWFVRRLLEQDPASNPQVYGRLEEAAAKAPVGSRGLLLLPYWNGVMNPYWEPEARGAMVGLTSSHERGDVYRALLEGIALEQALATQMIAERAGLQVEEYAVIGGGAASDLWCQIVADATGRRVLRPATREASSLGAAMCAACGAGWFDSVEQAAQAMASAAASSLEPDQARVARYAELLAVYRDLYPQLRSTYAKLAQLELEF
jgi:xylulokinase